MNEQHVEKRKEKILNWFKDPYNLSLTLILLLAFAIRLYYFFITKNQALWWDEACYGSLARNFISHTWDNTALIIGETHIRPLLFSFFWAFLMMIHSGEIVSRFILAFIPSVLSVYFVYLIGKEIYDKKVGLISAAIFAVIWLNLFYSSRFLVHMLELAFLTSSIYFFVKATKGEFNYKHFSISLILLGLATLTRYQDGMVFFVYFLILIFANKLYLNRIKFWYAGLIGLAPILLLFLMNFITQGNIFPALFGGDYIKAPSPVGGQAVPFAFNAVLSYIPTFLLLPFFIFFIIGLIYLVFDIILGYNLLKENDKRRNGLMLLLILIIFNSFFIFFLRSIEDRWLFETLICLSIISAFGLAWVSEFLKKYNKYLGIVLILLIILLGSYYQISFAGPLIKEKKESYLQQKQAFEWIKDNTPKDSIIAGTGIEPYAVYYSDRKYLQLPENYSDIGKIANATYLVAQGFVAQPEYLGDFIMSNNATIIPIHAELYNGQPIIIVYSINK